MPDYGKGDDGSLLGFEEATALRLLRQLAERWPASLILAEVDGELRVVRTGDARYQALATIRGIGTQGWPWQWFRALAGPRQEAADDPPASVMLPDGTTHTALTWKELKPYERQQGGYWLYGPWCGVHGEGKIFVRVVPPAG